MRHGELIAITDKMKPKPPLRLNSLPERDGPIVDLVDADGNYVASSNDKGCAQALVEAYNGKQRKRRQAKG